MKLNVLIILAVGIIFICLPETISAQPGAPPGGPPGGGGNPPCWPPPCIPIDGGLVFFIAAALGFGGKKVYDLTK